MGCKYYVFFFLVKMLQHYVGIIGMIIFPVKYLPLIFFFFKEGKLFSGIHLVSVLLALYFYLQNNTLSLYPEAFAILICYLLQYILYVGENKSVW